MEVIISQKYKRFSLLFSGNSDSDIDWEHFSPGKTTMVFSKHCYKPTFLSCSELSRSVDLLMTISLSLTSCSRTATLVVSWWMSFSFSWYSPSREEFCFLSPCSSCLTRMCSSSSVESLDFSSRIEDSDLYFLSVKSCQINTRKIITKPLFTVKTLLIAGC